MGNPRHSARSDAAMTARLTLAARWALLLGAALLLPALIVAYAVT